MKKTILKIGLFALASAFLVYSFVYFNSTPKKQVGLDYQADSSWSVVKAFDGYQTKYDPTKIANGASPQGQNTTVNDKDRISIRNMGYELFPPGTASSSNTKVNSIHTFRKRNGENIMMATYGTVIEYYDETQDTWEILKTGLENGQKFGFADYNINTDQHSYVYFGNAVDNFMRWNGAETNLAVALDTSTTTVSVNDVSGFSVSGTLIACGTEMDYSSYDVATNKITLSATSTVNCAAGDSVAQAVEEMADNPKGNIYLNANNRLFIAGVASTSQAVYFSAYGDATTFTGATLVTDSTADSPGIFNLAEGGGAVIGLILDNDSIYAFKKSIIYKITLSDSLYALTPLKGFDGKSQTSGAVTDQSIFSDGNYVYFLTPDNKILNLGIIENYQDPQLKTISNIIQPTVDSMEFDKAAGIVFKDKAYFSVKSGSDVTENDTILAWNIAEQIWDTPIVGFNATDFVVYDDGDGEELYFASNNSPNIYKVNSIATDDIYEVTANWRSKQFDFGAPHLEKEINDLFIDGYISENTTLTISLLLDEDGYTQTYTTELAGTESDYMYLLNDFNLFGFTPFGVKRFGSNALQGDLKKFRIYLNKNFRALPFYNLQLEFASDGVSQDWEITNFGFYVRQYSEAQDRKLFKSFQ